MHKHERAPQENTESWVAPPAVNLPFKGPPHSPFLPASYTRAPMISER